jgi:hypothetical protein
MYKEDQHTIERYAWSAPEHIRDVLMFARLTVRRTLPRAICLAQAVYTNGVSAIPDRIGKRAYHAAIDASHTLYVGGGNSEMVFRLILSLPGFGMAKAGFATQMLCGDLGCLDVHNLKRFGLYQEQFSMKGHWVRVEKRILLYKSICRGLGSGYLWDSWCEHIAMLYPKVYTNADHVSKLHLKGIIHEGH